MRGFVKNRAVFLVFMAFVFAFSIVCMTENVFALEDSLLTLNPLGNPFTVSAWINTTNATFVQSIYSRWYYAGTGTNDPRGFEIVLNWPEPQTIAIWDTYSLGLAALGKGNWQEVPLTIEAGREYHLAIVRNGTNMTFYLNGINRGSLTITSNIPDVSSVTARVGRSNYDINSEPTATRLFQGTIKNSYGEIGKVDIYDRAMPETLINSISGSGIIPRASNLPTSQSSSVNCTGGESQIIMSLYNGSNSHGANWSSSQYAYKVCYDQVMGVKYTGSNPHVCKSDNSNIVLKLSSSINAHAQNFSLNSYPTSVCYGDLSCVFVNGECPPGRLIVASLSSNTNAHISADASYPYKVCCSKQSLSPGKLYSYWMNSTGGMITSSYVNNSVSIFMETGVPSGIAKVEIYEDDGLLFGTQNIRTGANALNAVIGSDGIARVIWEITDADILAGETHDNGDIGSDPELEFYAVVSAGGVINRTGIIKVNRSEGPASRPNAAVNYPISEGVYFAGSPVNFSDGSAAERAFGVYWDVDDPALNDSKRNMSSFSHIYYTPGVKRIILNATNKNGVSGSTSRNIVILNSSAGIQVVPIIETPSVNSKVTSNVVDYGGGHSYVLNIGSDYNLSCLGGRCPMLSEGCPSGYLGTCPITIGNDAGMRLNYASMEFNWTFVEESTSSSEIGTSKVSGTKTYVSSGRKQIQLRIKAYSNYSGFTSNPFEITGSVVNGNGCSGDGKMWYENGVGFNTSISGNCGGTNRVAGGADDCCPIGTICTGSGGSGIKCTASECIQFATKNGQEYQIRTCDDYNYVSSGKQTQCEADCNYASTSQKQMDALSSSLNAGENIASTDCVWTNNACTVQYTKQIAGFNMPDEEYQCVMEVSRESECVRNEKTVEYTVKKTEKRGNSWVVVVDSDSKCEKSSSVKVKCGGSTIVLPFFDYFNLIVSILGVLIVYMFISFRKVKNR